MEFGLKTTALSTVTITRNSSAQLSEALRVCLKRLTSDFVVSDIRYSVYYDPVKRIPVYSCLVLGTIKSGGYVDLSEIDTNDIDHVSFEPHYEDADHPVTPPDNLQINLASADYNGLMSKEDKVTFDNLVAEVIPAKADKSYVDDQLALKTDKTYTDTELDKKANTADLPDFNDFALKSEAYDDSSLVNALEDKADKTYVDEQLENKVDASYVAQIVANTTGLQELIDNTYTKERITELLELEANADSVYTINQVDTKLDDKADKSNTYTKDEVVELINTSIQNVLNEITATISSNDEPESEEPENAEPDNG